MKKEHLIGMLAACSALLFVACSGEKENTEQAEEETVQLVKVARVTEQAVPQVVSYTATIEPYKRNLISSSLPNRIKKIYVEVGDHVKAGQKLVDLDRANLAQQKLQLDNLELEYNRVKELFAVGGASQQQVDQMRTQYETAKTSYENLDENTVLVSPTNGVVTARNYDNGDLATGAILTVMQIQPVKVEVNISESDFTKVKQGIAHSPHHRPGHPHLCDRNQYPQWRQPHPSGHVCPRQYRLWQRKPRGGARPGSREAFGFGRPLCLCL